MITSLLCLGVEFLEKVLSSAEWTINDNMLSIELLQRFWWDFRSVLTEELLFRGALLYILIQRLGEKKAILISAIAFGIYHWFSFGIIGNLVPMIVVFLGTGLMGYVWGLAFAKTRSILLPLGLHLGWNFTLNSMFSQGPLGEGLVNIQNAQAISDFFSLVGLWGVPVILWLIVSFMFKRHEVQGKH